MTIMTKEIQVTAQAVENVANINSTFADRNRENPCKGFSKLSKVIRYYLLAAGTADGFNAIDEFEDTGKEIFASRLDADVHVQLEPI